MTMGRKRKNGKGLPQYVVESRGWYFHKAGKTWTKLARKGDTAGMYDALSRLLAGDSHGTMMMLFERYGREVLPKKAVKTRKDQVKQLERLKNIFGKASPQLITGRDISRYLSERDAKVLGKREIALLSHVFTKAIEWGEADVNPCVGKVKATEAKEIEIPGDLPVMVAWLKAPISLRVGMALAYVTGQRRGDLVRIKASDFGRDGLAVTQNKTGTKLMIRWTPALRAVREYALTAIKTRPLTGELICSSTGAPMSANALRLQFNRVMEKITEEKGERFTFKSLRAKSAEDHATGAHLGHTSEAVLRKHYKRSAREVTPL